MRLSAVKIGAQSEIVVDTSYNFRGQVATKSLPYFMGSQPAGHTKYEYDCLGRLVKTTNPDTTFTTNRYDRYWTHIIDANGHKKVEQWPGVGPSEVLDTTVKPRVPDPLSG